MLISGAREFYERTGSLRKRRTAGYAIALATVTLALLARFLVAGDLAGFPFLTFIPARRCTTSSRIPEARYFPSHLPSSNWRPKSAARSMQVARLPSHIKLF